MPICNKCHSFVKKSHYRWHKKHQLIGRPNKIEHYIRSKGRSVTTVEKQKKKQQTREAELKKEQEQK